MSKLSADVVVDCQSGDCGKGKVVHSLAKKGNYTHVMRFSGGSNAGHTIYHEGKKFVTHLVPAGVFRGLKSIIGRGCVVDTKKLMNEISELAAAGIEMVDLLRVSEKAHLVTPEHVEEEAGESRIGTTKTGNGPAYRDKISRVGTCAEEDWRLGLYLIDEYKELHTNEADVNVLMEGAQGFYLDVDWGDYPYVTSATCTTAGAVMAGIPPQAIKKVYGVAKPYETYVGAKAFQGKEPALYELQKVGNEFGATTGRPRQTNWLDVDNLIKAVNVNGVNTLIMNKSDVFEEVGVFNLYKDGQLITVIKEFHTFKFIVGEFLRQSCSQSLNEIIWSASPLEI